MQLRDRLIGTPATLLSKALEQAIPFVGPVGSAKEVADLLQSALSQFGKEALAEIPKLAGMSQGVAAT
jgi:hypothetical protein